MGTASGRLDALVFMVGLLLGIFGFAEMYPVISNLLSSGALEAQTLPELFSLPAWLLGLAVAGMALGLFWVSAVLERRFSSFAPKLSKEEDERDMMTLILASGPDGRRAIVLKEGE